MRFVASPDRRSRAHGKLGIVAVYRDAALTYRTRAGRVIGTATIIIVPVTAVQVVLTHLGHRGEPQEAWARVVYVLAVVVVAFAGIFAATFYAGVVDRTVGALRGATPEFGVTQILRELPYWRLIRAELLYIALVAVGSLALVVPGLVAMTVFSIVGPVMLIEDRAVFDTFRRSSRLVRPSFWPAVATTVVPLVIESFLSDLLLTSTAQPPVAVELLVECAFAALVSSFVGLLVTQTAYQLIELDPDPRTVSPPA